MTMSPGLRKLALTIHLAISVGWIGTVAAYLVLDITVRASQDVEILRAALIAMELVTRWSIVPLAIATLATGLLMSLGTKWGLLRHWWVIISLVLTLLAVIVLLVQTQTISHYATLASDPATSEDELRVVPGTLLHSAGGLVVLLVVLVLNVYKPKGLTRYGWNRQQEAKRHREGA